MSSARILYLRPAQATGKHECWPMRFDGLFQVSAINALLAGVYHGDVTFEELSEHGDFGLGTFQTLDKDQSIFEFNNVGGTIIGFRSPEYVDGINVPGYHFHFITEDRQAGGHLLECRLQNVTVQIDYTSRFYMVLPESNDFYQTDLSQDKEGELEEVEK